MRVKYFILSITIGFIGILIVLIFFWILPFACVISAPLMLIALIFLMLSFKKDTKNQLIPSYKICTRCGKSIDYYASECEYCGIDFRQAYTGAPTPVYTPHPIITHSYPTHYYPHPYSYWSDGIGYVTIHCKKCGKTIRMDWKACPYCGRRTPRKRINKLVVKKK
jgi:RNA polymerase subunit RPABC4/transcription elongation factor Spt4